MKKFLVIYSLLLYAFSCAGMDQRELLEIIADDRQPEHLQIAQVQAILAHIAPATDQEATLSMAKTAITHKAFTLDLLKAIQLNNLDTLKKLICNHHNIKEIFLVNDCLITLAMAWDHELIVEWLFNIASLFSMPAFLSTSAKVAGTVLDFAIQKNHPELAQHAQARLDGSLI